MSYGGLTTGVRQKTVVRPIVNRVPGSICLVQSNFYLQVASLFLYSASIFILPVLAVINSLPIHLVNASYHNFSVTIHLHCVTLVLYVYYHIHSREI